MIISLKDGLKFIGISIVSFCAVFVCAMFLNYYFDATAIADTVAPQFKELCDAQIIQAEFVCAISGGALGLTAVIMLAFYIKLFINSNIMRFGLFKAMGYSDMKIASAFWVFGLSVFIGAALGFGCAWVFMSFIYGELAVDGMLKVPVNFHFTVFVYFVILPTLVFGAIACLYAKRSLGRNLLAMLKGGGQNSRDRSCGNSNKPFVSQVRSSVLRDKKSSVFFIAFAAFCFAAMIQMGASMRTLSSMAMGSIFFVIGGVLSVTTMIMAITTVINGNSRDLSLMKAFGYSVKERFSAVLAGYIPFVVLGFAIGTVYQYGLLRLMVDLIFKDVSNVVEYSFDIPAFFITLALFVVAYCAAMFYYTRKLDKISTKQVMLAE